MLAVENNFTQTTERGIGGRRSQSGVVPDFPLSGDQQVVARTCSLMESWSEPWNQKLGLMIFFIFFIDR